MNFFLLNLFKSITRGNITQRKILLRAYFKIPIYFKENYDRKRNNIKSQIFTKENIQGEYFVFLSFYFEAIQTRFYTQHLKISSAIFFLLHFEMHSETLLIIFFLKLHSLIFIHFFLCIGSK